MNKVSSLYGHPLTQSCSKGYQNALKQIYSTWSEKINKSASWLEFNKRFFVDLGIIKDLFKSWTSRVLHMLLYQAIVASIIDNENKWIQKTIETGITSQTKYSEPKQKESLKKNLETKMRMPPPTTKSFKERLLDLLKGSIPFLHIFYTNTTDANEDSADFRPDLIKILDGQVNFFSDIRTCMNIYNSIQTYWKYAALLKNLALRMADLQNFLRVAKQISETIAAAPALEKAYGKHLTSIRKLLAQAEENTELGQLIGYLQHLPLRNWNYLRDNAGKLLASYKLFVEHKDAFADAIYELGQLDAYLSLATLVQESQAKDSNHAYTFVTFLDREQKSTPYIKIDQMWNPFLDPKQAVGNSIEMDGAPWGVRNIILTGPNAGGKSTFLTGVVDTLLLAHVAGIGPAQAIQLTPFNKINTYIDVTDDVAAAQSLFMAEVTRAQKHTNIIKGLNPQEFSFTIFDEPFSGTNPTEGAAAEYSILESLGAHPNSLSMVATHYPTVMLLEEEVPDKGFANYKVYITRDSDSDKIHYTYKIVPGRSDQAIAIDILEEQGFDTSMLQRARQIIAHPEQYQAEFEEETED